MEGSFACPECGSAVEIRGLAPGRQVRCGFCGRLLEVPFLPRTLDHPWKRRRFGRPRWVPWAWGTLAIVAVLVLIAGTARFLRRYHHAAQQRSITQLIDASKRHEADGRLSEALIELDAALELAKAAEPPALEVLTDQVARRKQLARRDAQAILDALERQHSSPFPLGNWLDLAARCARDEDLDTLAQPVKDHFAASLRQHIDAELAGAHRAFEAGELARALSACDHIAVLLDHLPDAASKEATRAQAEALASQVVAKHGVTIEMPEGQFVRGSQNSYLDGMLPGLVTALESKGYLPYRDSSHWRDLWRHAAYRLRVELSERFDGTYLSSDNRLTRIEARLTLTSGGNLKWQSMPAARSRVPLPTVSAFASSRLESSTGRSEEVERLLYRDARTQIDEKVAHVVQNMPPPAASKDP